MKLLRQITPLALAGLVALQISCGDSSGPEVSASSIEPNSATSIIAAPGTQVAELPSVIVRDGSGNTLRGVTVTFAVTSGGGSVTGEKAVSSSDGVATVGSWKLGQTAGVNTLTATAPGLPAVTFTAQGADPCQSAATHALGSTTTGKLTRSDCLFSDGSFIDFYVVILPVAGTYIFTQTGGFSTYLFLLTQDAEIGESGDFSGANTTTIKAILPAGNFVLGANSLKPNTTGSYTLNSAATTAQITNCEDVFVAPGITSDQTLQTSDCNDAGVFSEDYVIFLQTGQPITVSMSSSVVDSYVDIHFDGETSVLASNDNIDASTQNARFSFTASKSGFYIINARTPTAGVTGAYTFSVQ